MYDFNKKRNQKVVAIVIIVVIAAMLVTVVQMTVKTALRIIHSHTMTLLKIQKMRMQEMRTLTKAWIQKAWPYMITCQLQGYSQPGMPVLFATVPQLKVLFILFSKPARLMEIRMRIG